MKNRVLGLIFASSAILSAAGADESPITSLSTADSHTAIYLDESYPIDQRVEDALSRMTLQEKTAIIHAQSKFSSPGVPRLGIQGLWCTDGPHGIRPEVKWDEWEQAYWTNDSCTAFPALTALASTWDPSLSLLYGTCIGEEARFRNKDVLLGPGVNIYRTPLNGRNFEYMGEDPFLAAEMVVPYIKGVQSNGVAACVKHFALNNQEWRRNTSDVYLSDRALHEIYLPAFKAAVKNGGTWSIMSSYNLARGQHIVHSAWLLKDILRKDWGFDGVVISDWGGTYDTDQAIVSGLDMEFGTWTDGLKNGVVNAYDNYHFANPYIDRLNDGRADIAGLDEKVRNVLRLTFRTSMNSDRVFGALNSDEHIAAARRIGADGIVLLKNERNILPIKQKDRPLKILVVGENAIKMMTVGGGSSSLKAKKEVLPLDALQNRYAGIAEVSFARGYVGDTGGEYNGVSTGQKLEDNRSAEQIFDEAVEKAKDADYVIFIGGLNKSNHQDCEGADRESMSLPYGQDALIESLAEVNPNVVVVNISGNAVTMPWIKKVPAVVQSWYLGSEAGNSLADILSGDINPSGKLPFSILCHLEDYPSHSIGEYPGNKSAIEASENWNDTIPVNYREDIFVGYRHADRAKITPLFPFGHGLSYTTFEYTNPAASAKTIDKDSIAFSIDVQNTGLQGGAETVQLYIADKKSSLPRPVKELKGFKKIYLEPGQQKTVTFTIDSSALSFYDDTKGKWIAEPGKFDAIIGSSSRDIRATIPFDYK